ncbi:MAG: Mitochondrial chaperone Frataxin [Caeruleum heppii]|nr:MAG: Mitochondrial chaperone Frataxin [Caeruleum heppii]
MITIRSQMLRGRVTGLTQLVARPIIAAKTASSRLFISRAASPPLRSLRPLHTTGSKAKDASSAPSAVNSTSITEEMPLEQFHKRADDYLDTMVNRLEELQEENEAMDVELSSGVLTLIFPPAGTYVLNKQPPNRQIWLSSPVSGPKRYDWDPTGSTGEWIYRRDGSKLTDLVKQELGIDMTDLDGED